MTNFSFWGWSNYLKLWQNSAVSQSFYYLSLLLLVFRVKIVKSNHCCCKLQHCLWAWMWHVSGWFSPVCSVWFCCSVLFSHFPTTYLFPWFHTCSLFHGLFPLCIWNLSSLCSLFCVVYYLVYAVLILLLGVILAKYSLYKLICAVHGEL